jgi:hypothetical protein
MVRPLQCWALPTFIEGGAGFVPDGPSILARPLQGRVGHLERDCVPSGRLKKRGAHRPQH